MDNNSIEIEEINGILTKNEQSETIDDEIQELSKNISNDSKEEFINSLKNENEELIVSLNQKINYSENLDKENQE